MLTNELSDWLERYSNDSYVWYVKRLTANDTQANGSHQAGPHIAKEFLFRIFPSIDRRDIKNPDVNFDIYIDSHLDSRTVRAVYYNNKFHENPKGGRNEARITGFGGSRSALLDPENTGAIAVLAFKANRSDDAGECHVWVCIDEAQEIVVEDRLGPIEPGKAVLWPPAQMALQVSANRRGSCSLEPNEIPVAWLDKFPTGSQLVAKSIELRSDISLNPDRRLLQRRACEYEIFLSVERAVEMPFVKSGFSSIDDFIARAQSILQRRKSRAGRSLELHTQQIFIEERLKEGLHFSSQAESEPNKRPDFLFPSEAAYKDRSFPAEKLRMLAVKTTCKDRWRQVVNEADRIERKHLLTLQEGMSENQFQEMLDSKVQLVVPSDIIESFPKSIRPQLITLERFITEIHALYR